VEVELRKIEANGVELEVKFKVHWRWSGGEGEGEGEGGGMNDLIMKLEWSSSEN
jgi:hypothetical protein